MGITASHFGTLPDGRDVLRYQLEGAGGLSAAVLSYGATIQSLEFAGYDVVLGYDSLEGYCLPDSGCHGATIGRYANRIANGQFELNQQLYHLSLNDGGARTYTRW